MENIQKKYYVYVSGFVGNLGTKILIKEKKAALLERYSNMYLKKIISDIESDEVENLVLISEDLSKLNNESLFNLRDENIIFDIEKVGKGGILAALWKICDRNKFGLSYSLSDIPILQGTVEISNFFDINPYRLLSGNGKEINNIKISSFIKIGEITNSKKRIRSDNETFSYLTKDYKDEIDKIINGISKKYK